MPLTGRGRRHDRGHRAREVDFGDAGFHPGRGLVRRIEQRLEGGVAARRLEARRYADPRQLALGAKGVPAGNEGGKVGEIEDLVLDRVVIAAVIFRSAGDGVGELILADEVPLADLDAVPVEGAGDLVDGGLDGEIGRRLAEAADRLLGGLVGGDGDGLVFDALYAVGADDGADGLGELQRRPAGVGPDIVERAEAQRADLAVAIEGGLDVEYPLGPVGVAAGHVFQPVFDQPHRASQLAGKITHQHGVLDAALDAVAAADVDVVVHPNAVGVQPERPGDLFGVLGHLDRRPDIQRPRSRMPLGEDAEGLDGNGGIPPPTRPEGKPVIGGGEVFLDRAIDEFPPVENVGAVSGMDGRRVLGHGFFRVDHEGQGVVVDLDPFGPVLGDVTRIGDDGGDPFAGIPCPIDGQGEASDIGEVEPAHQRVGRLGQLLSGDHGEDAFDLQCLFRADGVDPRRRVGAGHQRHMLHAGKRNVGDEAALAGDEAPVFLGPPFARDVAEPGAIRRFATHQSCPCLPRDGRLASASPPNGRLRRSADNRYSGKGCRRSLP